MTIRRFSLCLLCGLLAALLLTGCPKRGTDYEKTSSDSTTTSGESTPQESKDAQDAESSQGTPDSQPGGANAGHTDGEFDLEDEKGSGNTNTSGGSNSTAGDNKTSSGQKPAGDAGTTTTTPNGGTVTTKPQNPGTTTRPNTSPDLENRGNWEYVTF